MPSVEGVRGPIQYGELGLTLPHEHLFVNLSCYCDAKAPEDNSAIVSDEKVTADLHHEVRSAPWRYRDNTILEDLSSAIEEARAFAHYGGQTIVDVSACACVGRDPRGLQRVAAETGVNVIMACGRYTEPSMTAADREMTVCDIADVMRREFRDGVEDTGIKPGVLKAAFVSTLDKEPETRTLRAAGRMQHMVGCALYVHPHIWAPDSHLILDMLEEEGCDLRRVILCHQDFLGNDDAYLESLIQRGAYVEFDTFGSGCINDRMWQRCDYEKIGFVQKQIARGNAGQILISGDMCLKIMLAKWGGIGYVNIPKYVIPEMESLGVAEEHIYQITVSNPNRVLCH